MRTLIFIKRMHANLQTQIWQIFKIDEIDVSLSMEMSPSTESTTSLNPKKIAPTDLREVKLKTWDAIHNICFDGMCIMMVTCHSFFSSESQYISH
jgi:hypothetical protein